MAAKKKKRKQQTVTVEDLTRAEQCGASDEIYKKNEEMRKALEKTEPTLEEMRKAIEAACSAIGDLGGFYTELEEGGYTIRLSRHVKGRITYDPRTGRIVIVLPDTTLWKQNPDGRWDERSLGMHVDAMEKLHEARQLAHWQEVEIRRLLSLAALPNDAGQREAARQLAVLSRQAYEQQNTIQHLEWLYMSALSEAGCMTDEDAYQLKRARREKKEAEDAKNNALKREREAADSKKKAEDENEKADQTVDKLSATLQKQDEEINATKKLNSRLAAEANKINKGRRKQYKMPVDGKKGGNREEHRCMPVTVHRVADQHAYHVCRTRLGNVAETRPRILEDMELGRWEVIRYDVTRRWCPGCKRLQSTPVPGAGPKQRFGNRALTMLSFLKMIVVSFRKIELIFMVFYNVHISKKIIQEAVRTVSDGMMPQYETIGRRILKEASVNSDETSWRVTGLLHWV